MQPEIAKLTWDMVLAPSGQIGMGQYLSTFISVHQVFETTCLAVWFATEVHSRTARRPRLVVDAVQVERVSTTKFPANREKNREFCKIVASGAPENPNSGVDAGH